jgi:pimeloyl-ACP methyl ester carboxylesterase
MPVVFLHSNTGSSQNWEHQIPAFTAAGYRVIAYDRRGWGRSMAQPGAQPGTAADDLHALMKSLGIDRFHLLGTAGGGFVVFDYALSFPEHFEASLSPTASVGSRMRTILNSDAGCGRRSLTRCRRICGNWDRRIARPIRTVLDIGLSSSV